MPDRLPPLLVDSIDCPTGRTFIELRTTFEFLNPADKTAFITHLGLLASDSFKLTGITGLTGGATKLDGVDITAFPDGAEVRFKIGTQFYRYRVNDTGAEVIENTPDVVLPDAPDGTKFWLLDSVATEGDGDGLPQTIDFSDREIKGAFIGAAELTTLGVSGSMTVTGQATLRSRLILDGTTVNNPLTLAGSVIQVAAKTVHDALSGGSVMGGGIHNIEGGTLTATNPVTYNTAATVRIGGPPVAGANVTINNAWSLSVNGTIRALEASLAVALPIASGGTGASTAADARTNLGLGTMSTQAASAVAITGGTVHGLTDMSVGAASAGSGERLRLVGTDDLNTTNILACLANNLTQGFSIRYDGLYAIGSNAAVNIRLTPKGGGGVVFATSSGSSYVSGSGEAYLNGLRINGDDGGNTLWNGARTIAITTGAGGGQGLYIDGATGRVSTPQGLLLPTLSAPASASAAGTAGEIRKDASYLYICTATNTWKRVAISTW